MINSMASLASSKVWQTITPFTGGQPVGLDHEGDPHFLQIGRAGLGSVKVLKAPVGIWYLTMRRLEKSLLASEWRHFFWGRIPVVLFFSKASTEAFG